MADRSAYCRLGGRYYHHKGHTPPPSALVRSPASPHPQPFRCLGGGDSPTLFYLRPAIVLTSSSARVVLYYTIQLIPWKQNTNYKTTLNKLIYNPSVRPLPQTNPRRLTRLSNIQRYNIKSHLMIAIIISIIMSTKIICYNLLKKI